MPLPIKKKSNKKEEHCTKCIKWRTTFLSTGSIIFCSLKKRKSSVDEKESFYRHLLSSFKILLTMLLTALNPCHAYSHYLCANVKDRDTNGSGTIKIFYFCMNCIGKRILFHQRWHCQLVCLERKILTWMLPGCWWGSFTWCVLCMLLLKVWHRRTQEDTEEQHQTSLLIVSKNYIQVIVFHLLAQTKVIYLHIYEPINKVSWEYTQEYNCQ